GGVQVAAEAVEPRAAGDLGDHGRAPNTRRHRDPVLDSTASRGAGAGGSGRPALASVGASGGAGDGASPAVGTPAGPPRPPSARRVSAGRVPAGVRRRRRPRT